MPTTIGARILLIRNEKKLTNKQVGELCSTSDTTVGKYISGENKPKLEFLQLFADKFELSLDWIVYGRGPMERMVCQENACRVACDQTATDYERECLRLKHELADQRLAMAEIELAKGKQQGMIFEAVVRACREQRLTPEQTQAVTFAVMDYEGKLDVGNIANPETDLSHRRAAGE